MTQNPGVRDLVRAMDEFCQSNPEWELDGFELVPAGESKNPFYRSFFDFLWG